ncbi:winged helix DNA-binding domain-containing protein [Microbacterium sp. STN6]|uniref:winged helix-turn-helix domain-containing protein n=1 Tax=Microbacterium sp. STN6 TaxID=2995588 RepID=UPI002260E229|nr:crosslink repair DNA glycosylase YcaQ family protein [Microbacterium sp. STN6]MCX7521857.1 winged helix DNA-binding domain-containing protein [Microbacterium sp. STN6]
MIETMSAAQARRVALGAQGFGRPHPLAVGTRQLNTLIDRVGLLQIDSVNVFERSHYLPVFARLGAYDKTLLDRLTFTRKGRLIEYWAHEAAFIPVADWALMRWRMAAYRRAALADENSWASANGAMLDWLRAELAAKGPLTAGDVEHDANRRTGPWWGWSDVKVGLEVLFRWGEVVSAGRERFQRTYALAESILPRHVLELEIGEHDAVRELLLRSARAHGVGTLGDLADYYRIKRQPARAAIQRLEEEGELVPVTVRGWERGDRAERAWLHAEARIPRRIDAAALLSPFDPVVWQRERALRTFGFHYRIEIYTPRPKRVFGYYVLPVLLDDRIVGRVDLKSDRQSGVLRVQAAWSEADAPADTAARLAALLLETAHWQGLEAVTVAERGTLAAALRAEVEAAVAGGL